MILGVVNLDRADIKMIPHVVITRASEFGNPWTHRRLNTTAAVLEVETREQAIDCYRRWLVGEDFIMVLQLQRRIVLNQLYRWQSSPQEFYLACVCAPQSCHGDALFNIATQRFEWLSKFLSRVGASV